jgi:hypothetical protein
MECIIREAIAVELHSNIMKREESFSLSRSWKPLIQTLSEEK